MKILTPILLIVLALSLFFWFVVPTYQSLGSLRVERSQYEDALVAAKEASVKRDELVNKYNSMSSADLDKLEKLLPDSIDTVRLVVDLNTIAAKYGPIGSAGIRDIKMSTVGDPQSNVVVAQDQSPYGTLVVTFTTSMAYDKFLNFVRDLERSLKILDISSILFRPVDTGNVYEYTISLKTYWLR